MRLFFIVSFVLTLVGCGDTLSNPAPAAIPHRFTIESSDNFNNVLEILVVKDSITSKKWIIARNMQTQVGGVTIAELHEDIKAEK